ncbi:hypothetical protein M2432_002711 [Mycobacterium sp. OTB74]|nr:hypothetical protein [Mycobacterium sp. OTB74]
MSRRTYSAQRRMSSQATAETVFPRGSPNLLASASTRSPPFLGGASSHRPPRWQCGSDEVTRTSPGSRAGRDQVIAPSQRRHVSVEVGHRTRQNRVHKMAANPCPCAPPNPRDCVCPSSDRRRYLGKLSGPLMDRVDLQVEMHPVLAGAFADQAAESSGDVRARVAAARAAAADRWKVVGVRTNAEVPGPLLRRSFRPSREAMAPLRSSLDSGQLSIRGVDRTLRVAWSLADLAGRTSPDIEDVCTALSFRQGGGR